jgi:hypothetical protein
MASQCSKQQKKPGEAYAWSTAVTNSQLLADYFKIILLNIKLWM